MAKPWAEVESSEEYKSLPEAEKASAKQQYFEEVVSKKPEFESLSETDKSSARQEFLGVQEQKSQIQAETKSPVQAVGQVAKEALVQPAAEVWRGVQSATARSYRNLDNLQTLGMDRPTEFMEQIIAPARKAILDKVTGRKMTPEQEEQYKLALSESRFRPFKVMERIAEQSADAIPRSPLTDTWIGSGYNFVGEAPVSIGEFMTYKGLVGGKGFEAIKSLRTSAAIGLLTDADKAPIEALKSAGTAAGVDAVFSVAPIPVKKAYEMGKTFGKGAFVQAMRFLGVSQDSIDSFLKNPSKFKLWGKVENLLEKKEASKVAISDLKESQRDATQELFAINQTERFELSQKHIKESQTLTSNNTEKLIKAQNEYTSRMQSFRDASEQATTKIKQQRSEQLEGLYSTVNDRALKADISVREDLLLRTEGIFKQVELMKKQAGDNVGLSVEQFLREDPFVEVPAKPVINNFKSIFKKFGFDVVPVTKKVGVGKQAVEETYLALQPKIAGVDSADINRVNAIFEQMQKSVTDEGGLTVAYLQDLKSALQKYGIPKDSVNKTPFEAMYSTLSTEANVANMGDFVSDDLKKRMAPIFEANKNYRKILGERDKLYDLAGRKTTVTDPETQFTIEQVVPDLDKFLRTKDKRLIDIRRLREVDSILPEGLKLAPVVEKAQKSISEIERSKQSSLKSIKRRLDSDIDGFTKQQRILAAQHQKELAAIMKAGKGNASALQRKQAEEVLELKIAQNKKSSGLAAQKTKEMNELRNRLDSEIEFLRQQEDVRALIPEGMFGRGAQAIALHETLTRGPSPRNLLALVGASPRVLATGQRIISAANQGFEEAAKIAKGPAGELSTAIKMKLLQDKQDSETISERIRRLVGKG